ncbi:MAG TPA: hypothetical protein VGN01_20915 [Acidobacteriaceae bacterium]|jgi:hypothetical protein
MRAGVVTRHCISFGVPFVLAANCDTVLDEMLRRAPLGAQWGAVPVEEAEQFAIQEVGESGGHRLVLRNEVAAEDSDLEHLLEQLSRHLMIHVANHAPDRVFVHAGVVAWRGRALVLPGASFAGKTTLVAELVRAGATYYSDEYAVLDERGLVYPYPRELQMRQAGSAVQRPVAVETLHGTAGSTPARVSHVVFTEYAGRGRWRPEPVSPGMAVLEMLRHSIPAQRTPSRVMATLARMMETATALRSTRGEARVTAGVLLQAMCGERTTA